MLHCVTLTIWSRLLSRVVRRTTSRYDVIEFFTPDKNFLTTTQERTKHLVSSPMQWTLLAQSPLFARTTSASRFIFRLVVTYLLAVLTLAWRKKSRLTVYSTRDWRRVTAQLCLSAWGVILSDLSDGRLLHAAMA